MRTAATAAFRLGREHLAFTLVLALATVLRFVAALAYRPALFFNDSWAYIDLALRADPVGFAPERPSGYPLLLRALMLPGRSPELITAVQHLAGLASGVVVYVLLLRLGVRRGVATVGAAVLLLDSYAVALEQHVLTEPFFGLALLGSVFLVIASRRSPGFVAAGVLLGVAVTLRTAGLFAVPVWLVYLVWSRRGLRATAAATISLGLVVFGYAALHARGDPTRHANPGTLSLTEMDGWFLYAKVAAIADCDGAEIPPRTRPLCQEPADRTRDAEFYLFNRASRAKRLVGHRRSGTRQVSDNRMLRSFAWAIIRKQPWAYARLVADDATSIVTPGARGVDVSVRFPRPGAALAGGGRAPLRCRECDGVDSEPVNRRVRDEYLSTYQPRVRRPAGLLIAYQDWFHTPRWLMGLLVLVVLVSSMLSVTPLRHRLARRRETFLLGGIAIAVLIGSAATVNPLVRFLVPVAPLLMCAGLAGLCDLALARACAPPQARPPGR